MPNSFNSGKVSEYMSEVEGFEWPSPIGLESSLSELEQESRGNYIADIGAGRGKLARYIAERNSDSYVIGTDISPGFLGSGVRSSQGLDNLDFVVGEGTDMLRQGSADTVYMINMIQATGNPFEHITEAYDVLNEGGKLVVTVPGPESLSNWPEKAKVIDSTEEQLPYISTPVSTENHSFVNEQFVIPVEEFRKEAEDIGFNVRDEVPEEIAVNPRGFPAMIDVIEEGYEPDMPEELVNQLRENPDKTTEKLLESGNIRKVDKWVLEK